MRQISIGDKHHRIIRKEFSSVSRQTIYAALRYFNNSDTAKEIRKRALELLEEEVELAIESEKMMIN